MKNGVLKLKRSYFKCEHDEVRLFVITDFEKYRSYCLEKYVVSREKNFPLELSWHDLYPDSSEPPYNVRTFKKGDIFLKIEERYFHLESMPRYKMFRVLQGDNIFWGYGSYFEGV